MSGSLIFFHFHPRIFLLRSIIGRIIMTSWRVVCLVIVPKTRLGRGRGSVLQHLYY